jgi:hypothetical protein
LQIAIERRTVERNNDDFAAVRIVPPFLVFGNIKNREGKASDMAIFNDDGGTFDFIPVVHGPVSVPHEVRGWIVSQSPELPVRDAIA